MQHTVDRQVAKSCTGRPLHFEIRTLQEGKDGLKGIAVDFPNIC